MHMKRPRDFTRISMSTRKPNMRKVILLASNRSKDICKYFSSHFCGLSSVLCPQYLYLKNITGRCFRPEEILDSSAGYKTLGMFFITMYSYFTIMPCLVCYFLTVSGLKGTFSLMSKHIYEKQIFYN